MEGWRRDGGGMEEGDGGGGMEEGGWREDGGRMEGIRSDIQKQYVIAAQYSERGDDGVRYNTNRG